jgi:hypothetical protein
MGLKWVKIWSQQTSGKQKLPLIASKTHYLNVSENDACDCIDESNVL